KGGGGVEGSGSGSGPSTAVRLVRRGGTVVMLGIQAAPRELDLADMTVREIDVVSTNAHVCAVDLPAALELLRDPNLAEVAIDRIVPLDDVVADGLVPLANREVSGKVVVRIQ